MTVFVKQRIREKGGNSGNQEEGEEKVQELGHGNQRQKHQFIRRNLNRESMSAKRSTSNMKTIWKMTTRYPTEVVKQDGVTGERS